MKSNVNNSQKCFEFLIFVIGSLQDKMEATIILVKLDFFSTLPCCYIHVFNERFLDRPKSKKYLQKFMTKFCTTEREEMQQDLEDQKLKMVNNPTIYYPD